MLAMNLKHNKHEHKEHYVTQFYFETWIPSMNHISAELSGVVLKHTASKD